MIGRLAEGDLSTTMESECQDHLLTLKTSLNATVDKLADVIGRVHYSTDILSSAAEEISATAQSLSLAASGQASSVEETSA